MTCAIRANSVCKTFRQHRRFPGFRGALKTLFTKEYTEVKAVDDISFSINAGEAVGYLGPNGAGKSTMIKMMTGILVPTSGQVEVLGRVPHEFRKQNAQELGVVFGQRSQLWWDLPVIDSFNLHRHIYKIDEATYTRNLTEFVELLGLTSFLDRAVRQLSLGQRMRCEMVMALLHDPKILFLDEPTIGLDVVAKDAVRSFLAQMNRERGVTIVLTTHDMQDIESIFPRLIMVDEGKLLFDGPVPEVRAALGARRQLRLEFESNPGDLSLPIGELVSDEGARKVFALGEKTSLIEAIASVPKGLGLIDAAVEEPGIEEVIRNYYQTRTA